MDLQPGPSDAILLLYNFAVALSGGWIVFRFGVADRWTLLGLAFVLGVGWTIYFRLAMVERLATLRSEADAESS